MSEMKKYTDIVRLGHKTTQGVLSAGDYIVVYEKLDGANASFKASEGEVLAFSRNTPLSPENNLRGFYEYTRTIDAINLEEGVIYYGEWLVKHKVDYGENVQEFYLFDIFDELTGEYLPHTTVVSEAMRLGLTIAPILYAGKYRSYEHLQALIGRSSVAVTPDAGEGIVVKNVNFRDRFGKQVFVKLVSDQFREIQPQKAPKDPSKINPEIQFVRTFVTKARVDKLLRKLIDEGVIEETLDITQMGVILRNLGSRVYDDLIKEESDSLPEGYDEKEIGKAIGKFVPKFVREIIEEESN